MNDSRSWENPEDMVGVDEALERILERFAPLSAVDVPIVDALDMIIAESVMATTDVPPFRNSAMDGYAIASADTAAGSARLIVAGVVAAGSTPGGPLQSGEAIRIMTGAPMPEGADAVVRFEEIAEGAPERSGIPESIQISRTIQRSENVREPGEDVQAGAVVLESGTRLGAAEIGMLASLNRSTVKVHRRPRVAILSTGDEVVDLGPELGPGQIRNSNSYTIAAMVREAGGDPILLGVARDSVDDLRDKLRGIEPPDLYVTSGGVSIGDYDMVKNVLRAEGAIDIWQVRMKPGKPLAFGVIGRTPLLGLPGNPVAALVSFAQFGRPAIHKMLGHRSVRLPEVVATLTERITNPGRRRHYVRGVLTRSREGYEVRSTGDQGAAILTAVVRANCFVVVPETSDVVERGSKVRVQLLDCETAFR